MASILELLQLADASFPAGSFAFSNGLESLAKLGYLKSMRDFGEYLECHLEQIAAAEMPFLSSAFAASGPPASGDTPPSPLASSATRLSSVASGAPDSRPAASVPGTSDTVAAGVDLGPTQRVGGVDLGPTQRVGGVDLGPTQRVGNAPETFAAVAREWDAWVFLPAPRRASLSQGQAWTRAMEAAWDTPALREIRPWFSARGIPLHFLMGFAATLRATGFALREAQSLLLHMALRDQLGAAVRLGLIGSLQAQRLHRRHLASGEALLETRAARIAAGHAAAERAAPMIDLGQASHPHLYSKLFQS